MQQSKHLQPTIANRLLPWLARAVSIALIAVVGRWVAGPLGGVSFGAVQTDLTSNSTDGLFNWHPVGHWTLALHCAGAINACHGTVVLSSWNPIAEP